MNFVHPTPIQASTIPMGLLGRDIYACAATGTGIIGSFVREWKLFCIAYYLPRERAVPEQLVGIFAKSFSFVPHAHASQ